MLEISNQTLELKINNFFFLQTFDNKILIEIAFSLSYTLKGKLQIIL